MFKLTSREKRVRAQRIDIATPLEREWIDRWHKIRGSHWERILVTERREDGKFYCVTVECKHKRILGCEAGCMGITLVEIRKEVRAWEQRKRNQEHSEIRQRIGAFI